MKRDLTIDFIKGVAIVMMVYCHASDCWAGNVMFRRWVALFHMPVFYLAFGWFVGKGFGHKENLPILPISTAEFSPLLVTLWKRVKRLWWPFALWVGVFTLLHNVFVWANVYSNDPAFESVAIGQYVRTIDYIGIGETARRLWGAVTMTGHTQLTGAFWFLRALFWASVGYAVVEWGIGKMRYEKCEMRNE